MHWQRLLYHFEIGVTCIDDDGGADVIKVERPGIGDDLRRFGKHESWWKEYSRSKRSLSLNPRSEEGREVLLELVKTADVFVENFGNAIITTFTMTYTLASLNIVSNDGTISTPAGVNALFTESQKMDVKAGTFNLGDDTNTECWVGW